MTPQQRRQVQRELRALNAVWQRARPRHPYRQQPRIVWTNDEPMSDAYEQDDDDWYFGHAGMELFE